MAAGTAAGGDLAGLVSVIMIALPPSPFPEFGAPACGAGGGWYAGCAPVNDGLSPEMLVDALAFVLKGCFSSGASEDAQQPIA